MLVIHKLEGELKKVYTANTISVHETHKYTPTTCEFAGTPERTFKKWILWSFNGGWTTATFARSLMKSTYARILTEWTNQITKKVLEI